LPPGRIRNVITTWFDEIVITSEIVVTVALGVATIAAIAD